MSAAHAGSSVPQSVFTRSKLLPCVSRCPERGECDFDEGNALLDEPPARRHPWPNAVAP